MRNVSFLKRNFTELSGVIHNHSNFSFDCDVPLEKIVKAAINNRLDYLTINDHNTVPPNEAVEKSLLNLNDSNVKTPIIILGSELNDPDDRHHILVFGGKLPEAPLPIEKTLEKQINNNSILFAAHPFERRASKQFPLYTWTKTDLLSKVAGMEIWNYSSSWLSKLNPQKNGIFLVLFPNLFVRNPFSENLDLWDSLNNRGIKISAIGSTDAHGIKHKLFFFTLKILSHQQLFKTIRTNVLIEEHNPITEENILQALRHGNSYIVNYSLGNPYNFYAGICKDNEKGATFGEEITYKQGLKLYYRLPKHASVILHRNGHPVLKQNSNYGQFPLTSSGNYRLKISRFGKSWIYTNNIYIIDAY